MKEAFWFGGFSLTVLIIFMFFAGLGWPGNPDECIPTKDLKKQVSTDHTCYCEPFNVQDVVQGKAGIRQPFNTWSNIYALFTGGFLALTASMVQLPNSLVDSDILTS